MKTFEPATVALLEKLEEERSQFWNVPRKTAEFLYDKVVDLGARKILEIGTSNGYSGIFLAQAVKQNGGVLYTVESHISRFLMAGENFSKTGLASSIYQILAHAPEVFYDFQPFWAKAGFFDFIFVDATKGEYVPYIKAIYPFLHSGGVMVFDNCLSHKAALDDFFAYVKNDSTLNASLLDFDNGLLVVEAL